MNQVYTNVLQFKILKKFSKSENVHCFGNKYYIISRCSKCFWIGRRKVKYRSDLMQAKKKISPNAGKSQTFPKLKKATKPNPTEAEENDTA